MAGGLGGQVMTRNTIPDMLEVGIRKAYMNAGELVDQQYQQFYNVSGSKKRQEKNVVTGGLSTFYLKTEGNSPTFDSGREAWLVTMVHNTWALGVEITEEGMEDDLYSYYDSMGTELGIAADYTKQVEAMSPFNDLSATVYTADGTNYTLLSTSHFRIDGGIWANRPTTAVDLSAESLETALVSWRTGMLDQRGRKTAGPPAVLLVGPSDEFMAHRILMTDKRPGGNDNDVNATKARRDLKIIVSDFMTDDGRWFLLAPKERTGLVYYDRTAKEMKRRDDSRSGNMLMIGRYREAHGFVHTFGVFGSP